jgi:hypothetical protein
MQYRSQFSRIDSRTSRQLCGHPLRQLGPVHSILRRWIQPGPTQSSTTGVLTQLPLRQPACRATNWHGDTGQGCGATPLPGHGRSVRAHPTPGHSRWPGATRQLPVPHTGDAAKAGLDATRSPITRTVIADSFEMLICPPPTGRRPSATHTSWRSVAGNCDTDRPRLGLCRFSAALAAMTFGGSLWAQS